MSAIDQYHHRLLGFIHCPSNEDFVVNNPTRDIGVYEFLENILVDEKDFNGKTGDILIGGGSGEASAFRVSIPEAMHYFTKEEPKVIRDHDDLFKSFWSDRDAAIFSEGYAKIGWKAEIPIEFWLAKNICSLLVNHFEQFAQFRVDVVPLSDLILTRV